jgi:hypothetical protein
MTEILSLSPEHLDADGRDSFPWGGIVTTFADHSRVKTVYRGGADDGRRRYAYSVTQRQIPRTVTAGADLMSMPGAPISYLNALRDWATSVQDPDRAADHGAAFAQWVGRHADELADLVDDIDATPKAEVSER